MVKVNEYYSYNQGELPKGCQYCVKGEKVVIFVTGLCPRKCYFCPVSDQKYGHDVQFANEREIKEIEDIIAEIKAMKAKGAGITGGDPLMKVDRVREYILQLKKDFGNEFHVHLYTSLNLVTPNILKKLSDAGLDEIRFHFDLDDKTLWDKIKIASKFSWDIGVEVPLVPDKEKELTKLIDFVHDKVRFINLNELEMADNTLSKLSEMGMNTKGQFSYAIDGSQTVGFRLMKYAEMKGYSIPIHLCTAKLKDGTQLANRIKREGEYSKRPFDIVDKEGLLHRGAIYLPELKPGFQYREGLSKADKVKVLGELNKLLVNLKKVTKAEEGTMVVDKIKLRILTSKKIVMKKSSAIKSAGLVPAVVVEYPTADQLEMEVDFV